MVKIRFLKRNPHDFHAAVKKKVETYFEESQLSHHANKSMIIKSLWIYSAFILFWGLIISNHFQGLNLILLYTGLGILQGLIGFNISHDALHGGYSSSYRLNKWLGYTFDINGESSFVWKITHNGLHHTFTNIHGHDKDIDKAIMLRFSPYDKRYFFHAFQHFYTPILYSLVSLVWVLWSDYVYFYEAFKEKKVDFEDGVAFFGFKLLNLGVILVLPLLLLSAPVWQIIVGFLAMHMVGSLMIALVFQLAHLVEGVEFPIPTQTGEIQEEWAVHEMKTTCNFATESAFLSYFLGGLNFQVEHHLFPYVCHVHYPAISKIVKKTAKEYGVPYHEKSTLFKALKSHFLLLKQFGTEN